MRSPPTSRLTCAELTCAFQHDCQEHLRAFPLNERVELMPSSPFLCSRESEVRGSVAEVCANFISGQQYTAYVDTYVCMYVCATLGQHHIVFTCTVCLPKVTKH